jgi:hypothetical protein
MHYRELLLSYLLWSCATNAPKERRCERVLGVAEPVHYRLDRADVSQPPSQPAILLPSQGHNYKRSRILPTIDSATK